MREGIRSGFPLRFLEEYHLLEKVGPGQEIFDLSISSKKLNKEFRVCKTVHHHTFK
jgi:hypothetical protein